MAIIACWECQKDISSAAPACPHCGAPAKTQAASTPDPKQRGDDLIYENGGERITTTTALVNGRTYAVNGITAVSIVRGSTVPGYVALGAVFLVFGAPL